MFGKKFFMFVFTILLSFTCMITAAEPLPPMPCRYDGTVKINDLVLVSGFVYASINDYQSSDAFVTNGEYKGLHISPPHESYVGEPVIFWIKTSETSTPVAANEGDTFHSCVEPPIEYLDLTTSTYVPFCGNSVCEAGENSDNCAVDCPTQPSAPSGGGGGAPQPPAANNQQNTSATCTESWTCTTWSNNDCGTRTCIDTNNCGTTVSKPIESLTCPTPAAPTTPTGGITGGPTNAGTTPAAPAAGITGLIVGALSNPAIAGIVLICAAIVIFVGYRVVKRRRS